MSDEFEAISAEATDTLDGLLRRAFEAGRVVGRQDAIGVMRARLMQVVDLDVRDIDRAESQLNEPETVEQMAVMMPALSEAARASPGSVKPTILRFVAEHPGMTTAQIQAGTGLKPNSVRGTLWTLGTENAIHRVFGKWYPPAKTNEAADVSSAAPISQQVNPLPAGSHPSDPVQGQER